MLDFLHHLRSRYARQPESAEREAMLDSLALASAALCRTTAFNSARDLPPQVACIGPTQSGKSSVVNWLTGQTLAGVSPLAGFTRHPQGFILDHAAAHSPHSIPCLAPSRRVAADNLSRDDLDTYTLETVADHRMGATLTLWDTPDFDSLTARSYRQNVLAVAAMADVVVMVASRDKYGDLSVWRTLELLAPLRQPLIFVLNKVPPGAEQELREHLRDELDRLPGGVQTPLLVLPYAPPGQDGVLQEAIAEVRSTIIQALAATPNPERRQHDAVGRLLQHHWRTWTAPLRREQAATERWQTLLDKQLQTLQQRYRRDYLDNRQRYDALDRVLRQLLTQLEVPFLAQPMGQIRSWVTWPVRQVMQRGNRWLRPDRPPPQDSEARETTLLRELGTDLLLALAVSADEHERDADPAFWRALIRRLNRERAPLLGDLEQAIGAYQRDFQGEIEQAASELFERLRERPAVLNGLRAARTSADAAGIAVALKTGGIGVSDLVLTPAMLSLTTLLTEGALGRYIDGIMTRLRERQSQAVQQHLLQALLRPRLLMLADNPTEDQLFGVDAQRLAAAEQQLQELCHGR